MGKVEQESVANIIKKKQNELKSRTYIPTARNVARDQRPEATSFTETPDHGQPV